MLSNVATNAVLEAYWETVKIHCRVSSPCRSRIPESIPSRVHLDGVAKFWKAKEISMQMVIESYFIFIFLRPVIPDSSRFLSFGVKETITARYLNLIVN